MILHSFYEISSVSLKRFYEENWQIYVEEFFYWVKKMDWEKRIFKKNAKNHSWGVFSSSNKGLFIQKCFSQIKFYFIQLSVNSAKNDNFTFLKKGSWGSPFSWLLQLSTSLSFSCPKSQSFRNSGDLRRINFNWR